jgi:hypothetical protein
MKYAPPLYFVTSNTHKRGKLLANARVHEEMIRFAQVSGEESASGATSFCQITFIFLFAVGLTSL